MQVRNEFISKYSVNNPLYSTYFDKKVSFGQEQDKSNQTKEDEKKKGFSAKKLTNFLGVALAIGAIGGYAISRHRISSQEKEFNKIEKVKKKFTGFVDNLKESLVDSSGKNVFFKWGEKFNKISEQNKELFNNLIYGFGTVVVMPFVILFSPLGKKDASTEDKVFTVLRQPLSFATMFSMQLTVDKFFKNLTPKFIKKNVLEDKNILAADGKDILPDKIEGIKFNTTAYKDAFKKTLQGIVGVTKEQIDELFKIDDLNTAKDFMQKIIKGENLSTMLTKLEKYHSIKGKDKL